MYDVTNIEAIENRIKAVARMSLYNTNEYEFKYKYGRSLLIRLIVDEITRMKVLSHGTYG